MNTTGIVFLAIGGLVTIAGIVGVTVALLKRKDNIEMPGVGRWPKRKIPLSIRAAVPGTRIQRATTEAVRLWQSAVGPGIVELYQEGSSVNVVPVWEEPGDRPEVLAFAHVKHSDGVIHGAFIGIDLDKARLESSDRLRRAIAHEIGHCLGLAHDEIPGSIMYPKIVEAAPYVTRSDVDYLRETYG